MAFVPNPLPPQLETTWRLASRLSEADRALGGLAGMARNLPDPQLLIDPFMRREAVLSSRIEGTEASLSDLFFFEAAGASPRPSKASDVFEVYNYVRAMKYGLDRIKELPISLRLIRELHAELMEGVRAEQLTPGEFRRSQNWIGPPGCQLKDATFVPPPPPQMDEALGHLEKYLHKPTELPPLVRMALLHYQFEAIHPFLDGNGRIGRLLISMLLAHEGLLEQPVLYLSAFFEKRRDEYYRLLLSVSRANAWTDWIEFFLRGVAEASRDVIDRAARLLDLQKEYRQRMAAGRSSAFLLRLVDELFESPVIKISEVARRLGITHRSAGLNVQKLVSTGILTEVTGREHHRMYMAKQILDVIQGRTQSQT